MVPSALMVMMPSTAVSTIARTRSRLLSSSSSIRFSFSEVTSAVRRGTAASGLAGAGLRAVFDRFADLFAAIATYPLRWRKRYFPVYRSGTGEDMGESSANSTEICRI